MLYTYMHDTYITCFVSQEPHNHPKGGIIISVLLVKELSLRDARRLQGEPLLERGRHGEHQGCLMGHAHFLSLLGAGSVDLEPWTHFCSNFVLGSF